MPAARAQPLDHLAHTPTPRRNQSPVPFFEAAIGLGREFYELLQKPVGHLLRGPSWLALLVLLWASPPPVALYRNVG